MTPGPLRIRGVALIALGVLSGAGCAGDRSLFATGVERESMLGSPLPVLSIEPTKIDWARGLTLDVAVRAALERNPSLRTARLRIAAAEARGVTAAQPPFNPEIEGEWATGSAFGNNAEQRVGIKLAQEFETGGQRGVRIRRADVATEAVRLEVTDAERRLRNSVTAAFYAAVQVRGLLRLAEEALAASREFVALGERRLAARAIPESEVVPLRLDVARAEGDVLRRAKELAEAKQSLTALLGEEPRDDFELGGELPEVVAAATPYAVLARRMLDARPDLAALRKRVEEAEQALRLEYAERSPGVRAGFGLETEKSSIGEGRRELKDTDNFAVFSVSMPLPVFNQRAGQIAEGRAEIRIAKAEFDERQRTAYSDLVLAHRRLAAAAERLAQQRGTVLPAAEASIKSARDAFEAGQTDATPVLLAQERRREVRERIEELRFEVAAARVALESIVGASLDEPAGAVK